jgi:hypothetical protein
VYARQLTGLSAPAWHAVLLSALNRSGTSATVAAALVREGVDVAAAMDEAQDHGVLVRRGVEIGFRRPLLRTSVLALATAAQQRSAHRALADVLAAEGRSLAGTWHRAEAAAGPDKQLAQDLVRAADESRTRQGYAAASAAMERAALLTDEAVLTADWMATAAADAFLAGDADRTRSLVARVLDGRALPRRTAGPYSRSGCSKSTAVRCRTRPNCSRPPLSSSTVSTARGHSLSLRWPGFG